jgi:hypothetical protein
VLATIGGEIIRGSRCLLRSLGPVNFSLACLAVACGILVALSTLGWGPWEDEFWTITTTSPELSLYEFFEYMSRDQHPLLHYGLIYLAQHWGIKDVIALRSLNIIGWFLVAWAVGFGYWRLAITAVEAMLIVVLYVSSPIWFTYFAELRCYFLLYSASIAVSLVWYVLTVRVGGNRPLNMTDIATWGFFLAVFVNLHYFATIFGGILTLSLLTTLALRRSWRWASLIAAASFVGAVPALCLGAVQVEFWPSGQMSWITTTFREGIRYVRQTIVDSGSSSNVPVIACAVANALLLLESQYKRRELCNVVILLILTGLFFGLMVALNAISPLILNRYLIAAAGATTVAIALLAAISGAPKYLLAATSVVAIFWQAYAITWLPFKDRGFAPAAGR